MIKVSVLVLAYNHEKYIKQAVDSVLNQKTNFDYEIIVGDDASTDSTPIILGEYERAYGRLHIICRKQNIGGSANFVDLLKRAKGEYIASCEGDDYWTDSRKLQKQIDFLDNNLDYIGCTHYISSVDENGVICQKQKLSWVKDKPVYSFKDFKGIYLPGHPVSLVYRNIFSENNRAREFIMSVHRNIADRTTAMILSANGNIARLNDNMACYRRAAENNENLTSKEFVSNPYGKLTDMRITNKLERYARTELGLHADFNSFRIKILFRTLAKAILYMSKESFKCFVLMKREWKNYSKSLVLGE